jgi:hypothetical protein
MTVCLSFSSTTESSAVTQSVNEFGVSPGTYLARFSQVRQETVNKPITALGSGLAGVGLMYFFDPTLGKQRRALLVDKADHYLRLADVLLTSRKGMSHRTQGLVARGKSVFKKNHTPDSILVERIRAELGRFVSHASSIA